MVKSTSSRGRPKAIYHPKRSRDPVVGLMRLKDGRWRASGPEKYTFSEDDEGLAIAHFREWEVSKTISNLGTVQVHATAEAAALDLMKRTMDAGGALSASVQSPEGGKVWAVSDDTLSPKQWAYVRKMIIDRPKWAAERIGIEKIAYLREVKEPVPLPTFPMLKRLWEEHFNRSPEQKRKCAQAFEDFINTTGIKQLDDITPETVVAFRDAVYKRKITGKTQLNLFTRVRRYLSFFPERAIAIDEINRLLGYLKLLTPNTSTVTLDPQPIERDEWQNLLEAATGDDKAMILMMLNCAMYLTEVVRVEWDDIKNGCLITHRAKTGNCVRVATLWPETLAALATVKRRGPAIFYGYAATQLTIKGAELRFRKLRDKAGVAVTPSQLRDGAYTAAVEANVTSNLCQLLVGHRSGLADHYVKRKPSMVKPACDAIWEAYMQ